MTTRLACVLLAAAALLAAPAAAEARWTAWKLSGVQHQTTWDWHDTVTGCTSADPHVLSEKGSKTVLSFKPKQVHQIPRRRGGRSRPGLGDGIFHAYGPYGFVDGAGTAAVHAVQVVQLCTITGYDEAGDPRFGPDGAPVTDTCDTTVAGSFRTLAFFPQAGRLGRNVAVQLREDIGAEPDCPTRSGFGTLGPEPLGGAIPLKRVALSRFFRTRATVSLQHTRGRSQPTADNTVVGTTTTRGKVRLRRFTRPERCYYGRRPPPTVKRHFVCTPG